MFEAEYSTQQKPMPILNDYKKKQQDEENKKNEIKTKILDLKLKMIEKCMDDPSFSEYCDKMFTKKGMEKMKYETYKEIFDFKLEN